MSSDADPGGSISPAELQRRIDVGDPVSILDVRNRDEVEQWRIEGPSVDFANVPHMKFTAAKVTGGVEDLVADVDRPVVVVCPRGEASADVADVLAERGIEAANLDGGMYAWARLYESREVDAAEGATVVQYRRPSSGCLAYMVVSGDEAAVVDPLRVFADRYAGDAADRGVDLTYVVDTHVHADHVSGLRAVAEATGAEPVLPGRAADRGATYDVTTVEDGDTLRVGDATLEAVAAPGHTTGMTAFRVGNALLTGDALFVEAVPRPDLERDDGVREHAETLYETLTGRLARFDDDTLVAPGHYSPRAERAPDGTYTARLGDVRERLSVFHKSKEAFVDALLTDVPPRPTNFETIVAVNLGREAADDEDAFELELGPNNCAASPAAAD